ncbi:MAG: valine--tRNA ligase [Candidatus Harrisonbacteria bacterium RIFCSPLOWO2_02_FULL_45_10c]|uniref:valine--tRNA ligase n=1 Tax=Candidatus Harrisonbacteria bacterium RIFCSPLOWO2_02_FULL_45_10c TaxID=1798410 RepID=A0A1G1ZUV3_9BACT|nr:MAG: valine--tRNA ligase [Candidatus Harrisonbacteria bacterium RIFCSPLOWO2_02_FULL_45_10c]
MKELPPAYDPKQVEEKIYRLWEESGYFNPDKLPPPTAGQAGKRTKTFTITVPPPNVTGSLHMGHALNATIQDIIIRQKRMQGYKTLWLPGTDHAGIATQNVVEKDLKKQGISRHDLGREKFLEKVWEWKEKYGDIILNQFKKIGASMDWSRTRFTMDEQYQQAVAEAFHYYYKKGWLYKAEKVINWCVRCQTSLSDLELEYAEEPGKLWYLRYPLTNDKRQTTNDYIVVATTRPETMLGDTAVAVNPKDARYKNLVGRKIMLPIMNREIPIIADEEIDMAFGTGAVKVTPAHDLLDARIGEKHNLPIIKVIGQLGKMTELAGPLCAGLKIKECREKVIEELKKQNLIEKEEAYTHNVAVCYRCNTPIEPLPSLQWFLKMDRLAKLAVTAVKKKAVVFHPKQWEKIYLNWLENIRDWNISRQIWWGHKIPIDGENDVLDTWFSSALWPFATLGWPKKTKDFEAFYPTQVLSTARDIINLWVARMVFSGLELTGKKPFTDVIIHGTVLTKEGKRMSKSLGTGIDPMVLIEKYGADATRFGLIWQAMGGQDIHWDEAAVVAGKKFANKVWNIARYVLQRKFPEKPLLKKITDSENAKIIALLRKTQKSVEKDLNAYQFGPALHSAYDFIWHEFADVFIETSKSQNDEETDAVLYFTLKKILVLLHPFLPHLTEEIYQNLPDTKNLLMIEEW